MKNVLDIQCPACHAAIHFDPKLGKMKCEYCDNEFDVTDLKNVESVSYDEDKREVNYVNYKCSDCGAQIIADELTSATFCLYCGNTAILKNKLSGKYAPDKIIPFKVDKKDAIEAFKSLGKGKLFVPNGFLSEKNIEKITGLYVPFWLYEYDVSGTVEAEGTKSSTTRAGNVEHTRTDFYDLTRTGKMVFKRVPVDGSSRFSNDLMNSIEPYHYHFLTQYHHAYLSGYFAEVYDVSSEECEKEAHDRVINSTKEVMLNDMGSYDTKIIKSSNINAKNKNVEYVLLPVWMVNVKYKDKFYLFAMNGQTGEFIGDVPVDKKKVVIRTIITFIVLFAIIMLFAFFISMGGNS